MKIAHFSFANAQRDGQMKCSPQERRDAICSFFAWACENEIAVIGCTEGHRVQNGMQWDTFLSLVESQYGYSLVAEQLLGDQSDMSFGSQLFVHQKFGQGAKKHVGTTLSPPELEGTRWAVRAPALWIEWETRPAERSNPSEMRVQDLYTKLIVSEKMKE